MNDEMLATAYRATTQLGMHRTRTRTRTDSPRRVCTPFTDESAPSSMMVLPSCLELEHVRQLQIKERDGTAQRYSSAQLAIEPRRRSNPTEKG